MADDRGNSSIGSGKELVQLLERLGAGHLVETRTTKASDGIGTLRGSARIWSNMPVVDWPTRDLAHHFLSWLPAGRPEAS